MKISLNIHGSSIANKPRLLARVLTTRPRWLLVMDNLNLAEELAAALPETNVIFRRWPDDNLVREKTPQTWVNETAALLAGKRLWAYAGNEQGFGDDVLRWNTEVITLAAARGLKVVVGNFATGTPEPGDWRRPAALDLLRALDANRAAAVLGLHEYAGGVITSGLGNPPPVKVWPDSIPGAAWHCGRYRFVVDTCAEQNIKAPRVVITEHGFDDLSDIKSWLDTLVKTPGYANIRGWRSLVEQWRAWWPSWSPERAYAEQLIYADRVIYNNPIIEGQLIFSYGASSEMWRQFDIEGAAELLLELERYAQNGDDEPMPAQPIYAPDVYTSMSSAPFRVRDMPALTGTPVGMLRKGDTVTVHGSPFPQLANGFTWQHIEVIPGGNGAARVTGWTAMNELILEPKGYEPPAPPPDTTDWRAAFNDLLALVIDLCDSQIAAGEAHIKSWQTLKTQALDLVKSLSTVESVQE